MGVLRTTKAGAGKIGCVKVCTSKCVPGMKPLRVCFRAHCARSCLALRGHAKAAWAPFASIFDTGSKIGPRHLAAKRQIPCINHILQVRSGGIRSLEQICFVEIGSSARRRYGPSGPGPRVGPERGLKEHIGLFSAPTSKAKRPPSLKLRLPTCFTLARRSLSVAGGSAEERSDEAKGASVRLSRRGQKTVHLIILCRDSGGLRSTRLCLEG